MERNLAIRGCAKVDGAAFSAALDFAAQQLEFEPALLGGAKFGLRVG